MNFTQPVLLQTFKDEFPLPSYKDETQAIPEQVLSWVKEDEEVSPDV